MAPKSKKASKNVDVEIATVEQDDKIVVDKKSKRSKKALVDTNGQVDSNGTDEIITKPSRKKKADGPAPEEKPSKRSNKKENGDAIDNNVEDDKIISTGKGKKTAKEETKVRGNSKPKTEEHEDAEIDKEKVKPTKGRGKKAAKPAAKVIEEEDAAVDDDEDEKKEEIPVAKGRKKAQPKAPKEKDEEVTENKIVEEPRPKEVKRKKQEKKNNDEGDGSDNAAEDVEVAPASKKRKATKKKETAKDEVKENLEQEVKETKSGKGKGKGQMDKVVLSAAEEGESETAEPLVGTKRPRKGAASAEKASTTKEPSKNKVSSNYENLDFTNTSKSSQGKEWNIKISNWNVGGIRAWLAKGGLDYLQYEKPNILCLQEVKCAKDKLPEEVTNIPGYHTYWLSGDKDGYAGVGLYTTKLAINVQYGLQDEELDSEGRIITAEYEQFYLICTYVPNAGRKLVTLDKRLKWNDKFRKYVKELDKQKPVIICGDMNVAHNEIDLANPKTNKKNAGFTQEERAGMTTLLDDGFIDTYRHLNPEKTNAYTYWTYMSNARAKNVGWRLDYFLISERLLPSLCDSVIRSEVYGSDHCPISLLLHLSSADKPK